MGDNLRFIVEGLGVVFVGIFGIIGNISGILWFSRKLIQKNFHQLMLSLAFCDLLYVLLSIFLFGLPSIFSNINKTSLYNNLVPVLLPSAQISLTGSIYLTLAIALERYTTVLPSILQDLTPMDCPHVHTSNSSLCRWL